MNTVNSSNSMAALLSMMSAPVTLSHGQILPGIYVGSELIAVEGGKHDIQLHALDRKLGLPARDHRAPVLIIDPKGIDKDDPMYEAGTGLVGSFVMAADWNRIEAAHREGAAVTGVPYKKVLLKGGVFGGYRVRCGTLTGFLPAKCTRGFNDDAILNKEIELDVTKVDVAGRKLEFSTRSLADARRIKVEALKDGELVSGKVVKLLDCGALVDIGDGACGLVHRTEMVKGAELKQGETCDLVVLSKDAERNRIALSQRKGIRRAFARSGFAGETFDGTVIAVKSYGVFVQIQPGVAGLLHSSRIPDYNAATVVESLPVPLRVRVTKTDEEGERIDLAVVRE